MTALKAILTVKDICDGDKNPSIRHRYTIEDMVIAGVIAEAGDRVAEYKFTNKIGKGIIRTQDGILCECGKKLDGFSERCDCKND